MRFDPDESLTHEDLAALDSAMKAVGSTSGFKASFQDLVEFVHSLDGYDFSIYDYDNDVCVRESMDLAIQRCPAPLQERAQAVLQELDQDFLSRTVPVERSCSLSTQVSVDWHSRLPKNPGSELAKDIESGNL